MGLLVLLAGGCCGCNGSDGGGCVGCFGGSGFGSV